MRTLLRIVTFALAGAALATTAQAAGPRAAASPRVATPPAAPASTRTLRAAALTKQQFDRQLATLPDTALVESGGERKTKAQVRDLAAQKGQSQQAKARAALDRANAGFERRRSQLEEQRRAKLAADHAKAVAEFERGG
jgi:hypothetical protein